MRKLILITLNSLFIVGVISCDNRICCEPPPYSLLHTDLHIKISDIDGNDLLDQNNPNAFKVSDIRAFDHFDGQDYYIVSSNDIKNLITIPTDSSTQYKLLLSTKLEGNTSRTIVKWTATKVDTIDAEFFDEAVKDRLSKIVINGKEISNLKRPTLNEYYYSIHLIK